MTDNKGFIVGFSGLDGTGKTTQAKELKDTLQTQNFAINYVHLFSVGSTSFSKVTTSFLGKWLHKLDELSNTKVGAILELMIRLPALLLESWITVYGDRSKNKVTIYDRYYYDKIITTVSSYGKVLDIKVKKAVMQLARLLPRPDILFMYQIRPEVAIERKGEHSPEEAIEISFLYMELSKILSVEQIDAERDINDIKQYIKETVLEALQ